MSKTLLAVSFLLPLAFAGLGCDPQAPANPTYTSDVKAILDAHCARCHGAGDNLNAIPNEAGTKPGACYLHRYEDEGDCSALTNPDCKLGAGSSFCAPMISGLIVRTDSSRMPPRPSEAMTDWEVQTLLRWIANQWPR
jgi:hypothetical protein